MNTKEMDKLIKHFDTYFGQSEPMVLHSDGMNPHIDALLYQPNEQYPYWKLCTMGASDYKMPAPRQALGNRNEYIMFIAPEEDMADKNVAGWYAAQLMEVALYPISTKSFVTYGHSMEWPVEEGEEMVGAYLEMPQLIEDVGILRCNLSFIKTAVCLQVVLLTREEINKLMEIGPEEFSYYLYPEEGKSHFLCQRKRTEQF